MADFYDELKEKTIGQRGTWEGRSPNNDKDGIERRSDNTEQLIHIETSDEMEKRIWNKYLFRKIIGKGGFSIVISLIDKKGGKSVAAKVVDKLKINFNTLRLLQEEPIILRGLDHPNIIHLVDYVESQKRIFILLELMEGGDLSRYIKERKKSHNYFRESEVQGVMAKLLAGISYLHSKNVVHRDVKPGSLD